MRLPTVAFFLELPLHGQKQLCLSVSTGVSELPLDSIDQRSASIHAVFLGFTTRSLEHGKKEVEKMVRRNASLCFVAPGITSAFARSDLGLLGFPRVLANGYAEAALATCKHLRPTPSTLFPRMLAFGILRKPGIWQAVNWPMHFCQKMYLQIGDVYWHDCFGSLR